MSADKQHLALEAAQHQFLRHGFRRVTMGDIADAAGMSRPALYLLFANKESIFNAVLARFFEASLGEIEAGIAAGVTDAATVAKQLAFALDIWTVRPFELLAATPEAKELTDCSHDFATELVAHASARFVALIEKILTPHAAALRTRGLAPPDLAQLIAVSAHGIKTSATDATHLQQLINNLINIATLAVAASGED